MIGGLCINVQAWAMVIEGYLQHWAKTHKLQLVDFEVQISVP